MITLVSNKNHAKIKRKNDYKKSMKKYKIDKYIFGNTDAKYNHRYSKKTFSCDCGSCKMSKYYNKKEKNDRYKSIANDKYNDYLLELEDFYW